MRIVVTGGAGFIGSHLCEKLLAFDHTVYCVDSLLTGGRENITHLQGNPRFNFVQHDVTEPLQIEGPVDAIAHLASPASPADYFRMPIRTLEIGAVGTRNVLDLARVKGAIFLLASTSEVYGDPLMHPQREIYWGNTNPVGPRSVYDEAKRFAEAITFAYHRKEGLDTRIVRIFNTYGPRMRPYDGRVVPNFIVQALKSKPLTVYGDGTQTRSLCFVTDLVDGLIGLLFADSHNPSRSASQGLDNIHDPVNLGAPQEVRIADLARHILDLTGSTSDLVFHPLPPDDPKVRCPDITRARGLLNWEPKVGLHEGLQTTIEYFRAKLVGCAQL